MQNFPSQARASQLKGRSIESFFSEGEVFSARRKVRQLVLQAEGQEAISRSSQVEQKLLGIEKGPNDVLVGLLLVDGLLVTLVVLNFSSDIVHGHLQFVRLGCAGKGNEIELGDFRLVGQLLVGGQLGCATGSIGQLPLNGSLQEVDIPQPSLTDQ